VLEVHDLAVEVGGRRTLSDGTFTLRAGDKVGLVGRNGAGKTSLFRVLGGENPPADGRVRIVGALGYLPQDARPHGVGVDATGLSHVLSGRGLDDAARRLEKLRLAVEEDPSEEAISRYTAAEERFGTLGGYSAESEVRRIADGLGLRDGRLDLPITALSGGERRRVELARILFAGSDVLLLDEPTNHLDADAKRWITQFLSSYKGALLVISHDLHLLDRSITRILHLDEGQLFEYKGTYTQYQASRAADEARQAAVAARQQAEIQRLSRLADSMRGQTAKRARVAHSLDKRVERIKSDVVDAPKKRRQMSVQFPVPPRPGDVVLQAKDLAKEFGGPPIFEDVEFDVGRGERLLVLGLNGAGKTTLMRILAGRTEPDLGEVRFGHKVSHGYFAQEHEGIHAGHDLLWHMRQVGLSDQVGRSLLGMFGLGGDMYAQDAGTLSGGEKTKLALAQLVSGKHNLLLLDEPTNNLDPPSREAVAKALAGWPGAIVVVSHDLEFVHELEPDRVLVMPDGTVDMWSDELLDLVELA
jgi:ATPase subunit of ABC transporter with duplicated ATPase domains